MDTAAVTEITEITDVTENSLRKDKLLCTGSM